MRILKFLCVICLMTITALPARAANLPAGYTELEYIESTGTQYIDTGYVMTSDIVEYGIKMWGRPGNNFSLFGSETTSGVVYTGIPYTSGSLIGVFIGSSRNLAPKTFPVDQWNTYIVRTTSATAGSVVLNGKTTAFDYAGGIQKVRPLWLFGNNNAGGHYQLSSAKVASFYIKDNNVMVRNFVPAKNASGAIGMYDTVSGQFFTNAGTGTFTAGPVVLNPCRNLLNTATSITGAFINAEGNLTTDKYFSRSDLIPVEPNTKYIVSGHSYAGGFNRRLHAYDANGNWLAQLGIASASPGDADYTIAVTTTANTKYVKLSYPTLDTNVQIELGDTATDYVPYCSTGIKIATTKYTEDAFAGLMTTLSEAITKVTNIVDTTVQQATEIGNLATTKQDRPDTDCPAGRKCLLIMGADNKPHWYLIQE